MDNSGLRIIENAVVVPPSRVRDKAYSGTSAVYDAEGNFVEDSITQSNGRERHGRAKLPETDLEYLPGTHAFGGIFFGHFGHFITESTGRLWVINQPDSQLDSVVFVPKEHVPRPQVVEVQRKLLSSLGIEAQLRIIGKPTRIERLIVPRAEFGLDNDLIDGSPRYIEFMRDSMQRQVPANGADLLYISRRSLALDRGTILSEAHLERLLEAEGYTIWEPQKYSAEIQIAQYRAAKKIISVDASPLHLYAYSANDAQKVAIIKRRSTNAFEAIVRHIRAFSDAEVNVIDQIIAEFVHPHSRRPGRSSWSQIDFQKLGASLFEQGMIANPEVWTNPPQDEISRQVQSINAARGVDFIFTVSGDSNKVRSDTPETSED